MQYMLARRTGNLLIFLVLTCQGMVVKAQALLQQPYLASLQLSENVQERRLCLVHNFPGFTRFRLVYAYFDGGHFVHRISTVQEGYHKVWHLMPLPPAAADLQFESLQVAYQQNEAAYTLQCRMDTAFCRLYLNGQPLDSFVSFNPRPVLRSAPQPSYAKESLPDPKSKGSRRKQSR